MGPGGGYTSSSLRPTLLRTAAWQLRRGEACVERKALVSACGRRPEGKRRFGCGSKPMVPFWGRCTTHFKTYFSGDWDVHWGYGSLTHGHLRECAQQGSSHWRCTWAPFGHLQLFVFDINLDITIPAAKDHSPRKTGVESTSLVCQPPRQLVARQPQPQLASRGHSSAHR